MMIEVVVNGQPIERGFVDQSPLAHVRHVVLHETGNIGRRVEEWEFRNTIGEIVPADTLVEDVTGRLFLNLKAGVAA